MIDREHKLPISKQAKVLGISRGTAYQPKPVSPRVLALMNRIDRLHLELLFAGARMLRDLLRQEGYKVGRKHVATLMKRMGIEALYRKPRTTKRHPGHKVYPYLLRNLPVTRANQVWAMGLPTFPMARGFVYLAAVVDWFTRRVLSWKISTTMDALLSGGGGGGHGELRHPGRHEHRPGQPVHQPGFYRPAQGERYPHQHGWQGRLARQCFVERLWRSVKYEVHLHAYGSVSSARAGLIVTSGFTTVAAPLEP